MTKSAKGTALVTGASSGIGAIYADRLARRGYDLILVARNRERLDGLAKRLAAETGRSIEIVAADLSKRGDVSRIEAILRDNAGISVLVNNAGVNVFHKPLDTSDSEWRRAFAINLEGAWACARAVLPGMITAKHGVILNIASTHAFTIIPETFPYPVVKHALLGLTKSLALEYAGQGVRVNALAPGYVATQKVLDWWATQPDPEVARAETMALHPQGRIATPEEIARAAVFMISDECPFMTATCLTVDGGLSVRQHP